MQWREIAYQAATVVSALTAWGLQQTSAQAALLVGNTAGNNVLIFDERTGKLGGEFIGAGSGGLTSPDDLTFGSDGDLYVSSGNNFSGAILRYDGRTGQFRGRFDQGGTLIRPYGSIFGPDGELYVSSFLTDQILRYDGKTGAFIDVFAAGNGQANGLNGPNDLVFDAAGNLYVTTQGSVAAPGDGDGDGDVEPGEIAANFPGLPSQVLRFTNNNGVLSSTLTVFADQPQPLPLSFGFVSFLGLSIAPNGDLVTTDFANGIRSYDLATGTLKSTIATSYATFNDNGQTRSSNFIGNLTFTPDNKLYTVGFDSRNNNFGAILRYDGTTGQPLPSPGNTNAVLVATNANLKRPIGIAYAPISVPEPTTTVGLLAFGAAATALSLKRDRKSSNP
ncbi:MULTISPECIES: PEP-CTERM sorting domain-containing protein [Trichocoleus]|uniref:PEP-CTERM sorting domain-containing protein n=1 Tax=Trichocoleus desertorum GB2-A4 TaxID=2933944 RepID=A0ABV0J7T3_9CYAN|nr:PEP-CTERM sorting domain-containing protein [Trichocoleus sp. FACHB-46]